MSVYFALGLLFLVIVLAKNRFDTEPKPNGIPPLTTAKSTPTTDSAPWNKADGSDCLIFFGSQTGTAEDYGQRLAQEAKSRYGLTTTVVDLEEYDLDHLHQIPKNKICIFVLATYGEGEPTDNAVAFSEFIMSSEAPSLENLSYSVFGLGNSTYEQFNWMAYSVDKALMGLGASRLGEVGVGDDGNGTLEEDFMDWKMSTWDVIAEKTGLTKRQDVYQPAFSLTEASLVAAEVLLGEHNAATLDQKSQGPFDAHNPYFAKVSESRELFTSRDRNCLHLEVDLGDSNLTYKTGDHVAVWPNNPGDEVDLLLRVFAIWDKRHQAFDIKSTNHASKKPFPSPITLDSLFRNHLEICAPVSRQTCANLARFAPNESIKAKMTLLGGDKDVFLNETRPSMWNTARLLESISDGATWENVPLSAILECFSKLQPRYYSISSSSLVQPRCLSITAVVESKPLPDRMRLFKGVTTNYLLSVKQEQNHDKSPGGVKSPYQLFGPRNTHNDLRIPIHIRHSHFRLPEDTDCPIIMIGPGTGVAPFRGFMQERVEMAKQGKRVGQTLLFFGCRNETEDYLYRTEWANYKDVLGASFEFVPAFSRAGPQKLYVQHRLQEYASTVDELLSQGAYIYICGDASNMARSVHTTLAQILVACRQIPQSAAEKVLADMKAKKQLQEDVW